MKRFRYLTFLLFIVLSFSELSNAQHPVIQQMVQKVSGDSIFATMADLQLMDRVNASNSMIPADYLRQRLTDYQVDTVIYQYFKSNTPPNVIGIRYGLLPTAEYWVMGAHYDAVRPGAGADDNASGTAAVLEMARVTKGQKFDHHLLMVLFAAEEVGLWGSNAFVDSALNHFPIAGMINLDMIAYSHQMKDSSVSVCYRYFCVDLLNGFVNTTTMYVPELQIDTDSTSVVMYASDHAPFWQRNIPALFLIENSDRFGGSFNPYYHTFDDTIGTGANSPWLAEKISRSAIATLLQILEPWISSIHGNKPAHQSPISFPNPTSGWVNIHGLDPLAYPIQVNILDPTAKLVVQSNFLQPGNRIDLTPFPDGLYFVNVKHQFGNSTFRVVKVESRK